MTALKTISVAQEAGSDLSSRTRAAALRARLLADIESGHAVVLDFADVRTISDSFADELFAVTVIERGEEWFRTHFTLQNLRRNVRVTILEAISERLSEAH